jgi:hypothetical protein
MKIWRDTVSKRLRVIFDGEVLRPEEPVDLEPSAHYVVTIERPETFGDQTLWEVLSNLTGSVEGPKDWAEQHDHYLYGIPKRRKA